ncbi:hypothetical protein ACIR03_02720 [Clostridium cochlearium]|uniref:hypothetical protein n=1 Tax=Clostridium cochlearium TaxID=1494 RepID=UPI0015705F62|nr:hypothetical protein [Clostridium cochlearium]MBV1816858.1 hypothetical protein [Bacteroidales bacterium MSK.15.36]MCG4571777.1 hypothetical protein [Clostridium cochlearium]MCG4579106.1 hypothetical protein [Clostridium cochlearium]NSJ90137.1 hypothetical protein [Coprococcus sp. MSK.21.13]
MSKINRGKISKQIYKQLEKKGLLKEIKVLRNGKNAYGEKLEDLYVTTIKGYYYRKENKINISSDTGATINTNYYDKLLVAYNEESKKIKQDDYFTLDGTKYKIIDTGNVEDIIFDMILERR